MKIAIIYHSETGNTKQMADLVRQGCGSPKSGMDADCGMGILPLNVSAGNHGQDVDLAGAPLGVQTSV